MPIHVIQSYISPLCNHNLGMASAAMWTLRAEGHLFHSGLPHKGINSLELGMEAITYVQNKFYQDFPPVRIAASHPQAPFSVSMLHTHTHTHTHTKQKTEDPGILCSFM